MGIAPVLNQIHCSHAAHVVRVAHKFAAWGVQADFAAVSAHPAATRSFSFLARAVIVIDTVVVLTQHGQVRGFGVSTMFVCVDMVDLAPIRGHIAVRPGADEILGHGQGAQLVGGEPCFVEIHRAGGGVEETDIEFVAECAFHCGVDEFGAGHGRAVG